ncbi:MAG: hypothetical protein OXP75_20080 [Rhodospirillales bacterium]|nr:hypothetical protein [Rhodospirillales bacterium]
MDNGATQQVIQAAVPRRPTGPGMTIPRLTFAEQLVLWSARRLATANHGAAVTEAETEACRQDVRARVSGELSVALCPTGGPAAGTEAAQALERALDIFGCAGVRSLRLNPMCCRFVSNDERLFLSFLASCQEGDYRHAAALLSWFLPPASVRTAAADGAAFARALFDAGFQLPQRITLAESAGFPSSVSAEAAAPHMLH